jgi:hypothetical protein
MLMSNTNPNETRRGRRAAASIAGTRFVGVSSPSKRVKALHRANGQGLSLRAYARVQAKGSQNDPVAKMARQWLTNKGVTQTGVTGAAR